MRKDGPPFLFVAVRGLFAAAMMLGQFQMMSRGVKLASIIDVQDPEVLRIASLDRSRSRMPTNLPARRRITPAADRRMLLTLAAVVGALMGLALAELAFTDTTASADIVNPFGEIAEY